MKNKPLRHKDFNTFKFQPFAERIANIDIDIFHRVGHENETESEEAECNFYQAIDKWNILNLTESYDLFKKEVKPFQLVTLPQLILNKERVVEVLLKHLRLRNPLCLQPLLEIVVAVAKDLRKDFYEYYREFLEVIINLLNTKDTEQLEWAFTCLAYLFKFLWRHLLKDITIVFNTLLPLLSDLKPDYINSFAAGSFAFVARKVKDWPNFLSHILKTVKTQKDGVEGCGKLFFEVIHGISGQFHSCAETVLPFLVDGLSDDRYHQKTLFDILEVIVQCIISNIKPDKGTLLLQVLLDKIEILLTDLSTDRQDRTISLIELILKLLGQIVEFRSGRFVQNPVSIIGILSKITGNDTLPDSLLKVGVQISILLLLSKNIKLSQEQAAKVTRHMVLINNESMFLYFVDNVSKFSSFEALILPAFLDRCVTANFNIPTTKSLTKLILNKAPLCESGINLVNWARYSIDFRSNNNLARQIMLERLDQSEELFVSSLICMPHLVLSDTTEFLEVLKQKVIMNITESSKNDNKKLFLLNLIMECIIHLNGVKILEENFDLILNSLSDTLRNSVSLSVLKIIDMLIYVVKDTDLINIDTLNRLNELLITHFSSPYHEIRLLISHIYTFFDNLPEFDLEHSPDPDVAKEKFKVFTICYTVESIDPQVHTYRDQLQNLAKLNFDKPQMIMCNKTEFRTIPLRYLCGMLYMNFKLLWSPVSAIIETHAHGLAVGDFWKVFGGELKNARSRINGESAEILDIQTVQWDFLDDLYKKSQQLMSLPDFSNYRLLLWTTLCSFTDIAEMKTRDVSELFLEFIEYEYAKKNSEVGSKLNIKQHITIEKSSEEDLGDESNQMQDDKSITSKHKSGKNNIQVLLKMLEVFSKVRSPRSLYREPELNKLYFEFLQHKNFKIQKLAMDCIFTYKHKYLTPYKEHLYNLIDDKNFKNELNTFRIDRENKIIQDEHRDDLIPLIMKIVFSKMSSKTGLRTGGKSSGQFRRNLVLRFLAGCEEKEMLIFVKMAFRFYAVYMKDDPEELTDALSRNISLENFIPPKRLQSSVNLLSVILDQFGGLMGNDILTYILQIALILGGTVKIAFENVTSVHAGYFMTLRSLRTSIIKIISRFFENFDRYPWTNKQINSVFDTFVWPFLDKLNIEGIHSPTTLLKLFTHWGSHPRYFSLLIKHKATNDNEFVLPHIIKLLLNEKSHISVVDVIQEMIEKLLTLQANEDDLQLVIPVDNLLPIAKSILDRVQVDDKLNYGSCILLPHIPGVLEKIKRRLQGKNKNLNQRELFILSRISELVWESDLSDDTLKLLLPVVLKRCSSLIGEEVVVQLLTTIRNLLNNIDDPRQHLRQIIPLFGEVSYPSGRKLLIQCLKVIAVKLKMDNAVELVDGLNAFDAKWVDQPDFERRHNTFKAIQSAMDENKIDLELGLLLIYNCYYLLKSEKDLSVKENSSYCLKQLTPYLISNFPKDVNFFLNDVILNLIRQGMKSRNGDFRNDCILFLGHLSRECSSSHVVLRDLNRYTNKNDLEVDFFENITHLQIHRHARALLKFCNVTRDLTESPNVRTLTQFILPMASFYLCNEKYTGKNSVIDAAIECIGTVCRILPWHQYGALLKYYLERLRRNIDFQKQLVRITVAILDGFHFDLTKGHVTASLEGNTVEAKNITTECDKREEKISENETDETLAANEVSDILDAEKFDLENGDDEEIEEEEEEEEKTKQSIKISEKISILCKSTATRVIKSIQLILLPQLHKALAELTHHDTSHKINRKKTGAEREEEDLQRVPISLALVKLLQRLPTEILDANLPGIFMKMCTFLKSHLESVRRTTRETLQKIMLTLGPNYLGMLIGEMRSLLNRGFQVHVLVYTVHAVLSCLKQSYGPGDIDKVLLTVLQLCKADLFGILSEEKEVAKVAVKTSEAKATKSFDTFQILAQFSTEKCLMELVIPIKDVLLESHSFKNVHKAQECLRHISLGLVDNQFVGAKSLLIFAYGISSESIPQLLPRKSVIGQKEKVRHKQEDCFIIPKAPVGRGGVRVSNVKTSVEVNAHILIEFGVRLCYVLLKRDKLKDADYKPFLDPFITVFCNCITSKHVKLSTITLQCLMWIMKFELPTLQENIKQITEEMFAILHKYASAGLGKGENFDLVVATFKTMAVLVRDVKYHTIDTEQLKILLLYAEQDMHDHDRQATAFNLLKAIITRQLIIPEIDEVMTKVAELSITSEMNHVRAQARAVFHQYIMDYPLGDKLEKHVSFYIAQMGYELQYGRESALEMINTLITTFPLKTLHSNAGALFVTLGARLVNDEVPECRKYVANCLSLMLGRLKRRNCGSLFDIVLMWLADKNMSHRRLAAQLCGIFVTTEKSNFEMRLPKLLPLVLHQFFLPESDEEDEAGERIKDHLLFQVLQMLLKICAQCPSFLKMKELVDLSTHVQKLLGYPHEWVRLSAAQFLGFVLGATDIDDLAAAALDDELQNQDRYLFNKPLKSVKTLTLDLCDQLRPGIAKSDLAEQVIKNLVFIARLLAKVSVGENDNKDISLLWLIKRMRKVVNSEIIECPSSIILRNEVFKWIAAIATVVDIECITPYINHLLAPLIREMITTEESNAPLRQLSKEVAGLYKKSLGVDTYTQILSSLQQQLSVKRAERKRARTQLAVTDPEAFAKKKIKRHDKKKDAKKRKVAAMKGKKIFNKRRKVDLDPEAEVM